MAQDSPVDAPEVIHIQLCFRWYSASDHCKNVNTQSPLHVWFSVPEQLREDYRRETTRLDGHSHSVQKQREWVGKHLDELIRRDCIHQVCAPETSSINTTEELSNHLLEMSFQN